MIAQSLFSPLPFFLFLPHPFHHPPRSCLPLSLPLYSTNKVCNGTLVHSVDCCFYSNGWVNMVVEYVLHSDWKWNEVWKVQGEKEIKVLHVIDVHVILFPGLPQHCDFCLLMHTLLRPFSLQKQSCDGNYKTVGQNVTILAPVLWNQYVFLLMSTLLLFSVITVTMIFQETLRRQMIAMIPHHTHTHAHCDACEHTWDAYTLDWACIDTWQELHVLQCILTHTATQPPRNFIIIMYY